jgi:hypothetical protein
MTTRTVRHTRIAVNQEMIRVLPYRTLVSPLTCTAKRLVVPSLHWEHGIFAGNEWNPTCPWPSGASRRKRVDTLHVSTTRLWSARGATRVSSSSIGASAESDQVVRWLPHWPLPNRFQTAGTVPPRRPYHHLLVLVT